MKRDGFQTLQRLILAALLIHLPILGHGQPAPAAGVTQPGGPPAPTEREANGVRYLTGGVGVHEADKMRAVASRFSLQLTFTGTGGKFLGGVDVRVLRQDGSAAFNTVSDGPFLFVHMPPGQYRVVASYQGQQRETSVTVPAQGSVARTLTWTTG